MNESRRKVMAACLLALLMVLVPWSAFSSPAELEYESGPFWVTGSSTASADTMLNVTAPNATEGSSYNLNLSSGMMDERPTLLFTFPLTSNVGGSQMVPAAGSIQSASVTLHFVYAGSQGSTYIHAAALNGTYEEANATYLNRTHNTTWSDAGANGDDDRGPWEPRAQLPGSSGSVTVNITAIAQQTLAAGLHNLSIAVSSSGNHNNDVYNSFWSEKHHGIKEVLNKDGEGSFEYDIDKNSDLAQNLKGHLLLTTGDIDNNVHPVGTLRMAEALIRANKRFDFFMFPGQRHGYGDMSDYWFWLRAEYFVKHLLGDDEWNANLLQLQVEQPKTR